MDETKDFLEAFMGEQYDQLITLRALIDDRYPRFAYLIDVHGLKTGARPPVEFARDVDRCRSELRHIDAEAGEDDDAALDLLHMLLDKWSTSAPAIEFVDAMQKLDDVAKPRPDEADEKPKQSAKGKDINGRMNRMLEEDANRIDWTARDWADKLGCSVSSVHGTPAWDTIKATRALKAAEEVNRQRGRR